MPEIGHPRRDLDGAPGRGHRRIEITDLLQRVAEVVPGLGEIRPQLQRFLKGVDGLFRLALLPKNASQMIQRLGVIAAQGQSPLAGGDSIIQFTDRLKRVGKIDVSLGIPWPKGQDLAEGGD